MEALKVWESVAPLLNAMILPSGTEGKAEESGNHEPALPPVIVQPGMGPTFQVPHPVQPNGACVSNDGFVMAMVSAQAGAVKPRVRRASNRKSDVNFKGPPGSAPACTQKHVSW